MAVFAARSQSFKAAYFVDSRNAPSPTSTMSSPLFYVVS